MSIKLGQVRAAPVTSEVDVRSEPLISIREVSKVYYSGSRKSPSVTTALDQVSIDLGKSEFLSIVGPSGCGKTTVLRIMAGLLRPDSGTVLANGRPISGPSSDRAVVFQRPALLPWASVEKNVALGLRLRGEAKSEQRRLARAAIESVGLKGYEDYLPRQLSGGMAQRAALARALVLNPPVLLMDEPFASLDAITRRKLHGELLSVWSTQPERSAVFITHNVDEAIILADRIVVMSPSPGQVAEIVDVPLPRPRRLEDAESPEYLKVQAHIWSRIESWASN